MFQKLNLSALSLHTTQNGYVITPKFSKIAIYDNGKMMHTEKNIIKLCYKNSNNLQIYVFYRKFADYLC
jgi:hypothetical protein